MGLGQVLKKGFSDAKILWENRYFAVKFVLVCSSLLFFLNLFFLTAWFYTHIFSLSFQYIYLLFVVSLFSYIYFFAKKYLPVSTPKIIFVIIAIIVLIAIVWSILVVNNGVQYIYNLI